MERLPVELTQQILTHLDLASLKNAVLSSRTFLDAFQGADVMITSEILIREVNPGVLIEAVLVDKSWQPGEPRRLSQWSVLDALPQERCHKVVSYLVEGVVNGTLY
ncbi:uncharacterized protein GGS25DRAFT_170818 [Hypoxylon fragiforme]|uniref:uncharacterized protein n=1 Tax=Hypoxylon fragiforme TaxID=63214 RepID=UPI0020C5BE17|nr:uncharacterized protein GGS25DRAFT_170818 [Hypoxylon fragiforme]KAI2610880.1 hypothetical protein GGS25DRAFT_170818 [Hypoxylon fragiforme]